MSTAMHRKNASAPLKWLYEEGYLDGQKKILDFGCGHGTDVTYLRRRGVDAHGYDPTWKPDKDALMGKYDVVLCTYVLNTIRDSSERRAVMRTVRSLLKSRGRAFVTVRRDIRRNGSTTRGWQGNVDVPRGESLYEKPWFELFEVKR